MPAPLVVTQAATAASEDGATLHGTVDPRGASTAYHFQYGLTTSYGSVTSPDGDAGSGSGAVAESEAITGLAVGTTYHYRLVATNASGTTNGADLTFATLPLNPLYFSLLFEDGSAQDVVHDENAADTLEELLNSGTPFVTLQAAGGPLISVNAAQIVKVTPQVARGPN